MIMHYFVTVLEAVDWQQAIQYAVQHPDLDLVLLGLYMPGFEGKGGFRSPGADTSDL